MQFYHEVDKKAFPVQNGSKWLCGHFKHVVKGLLVDIYIFVDVNVMLLLIACGCLRVVLNVKKSFLHIYCDVQNLYIYIYISFGNFVLGSCDVGKLYVTLGYM